MFFIILGILAICLIVGIEITRRTYRYDMLCFCLIIPPAMVLFISAVALPMKRIQTESEIMEFKSVVESLERARGKDSIENAAMQLSIIEKNQWLARKKYWNSTLFDPFIPDEIETLEPIK